MSWLSPLRRSLDAAPRPVELFLRDDDAGWADARLLALIDLIAERHLPLDLAVIPRALRPELASVLLERRLGSPAPLGFHQHGLAHRNHEAEGRRYEFGRSRPRATQLEDIAEGMRLLEARLGPLGDPIFTPPWNRCTATTGECLAELGFRALSRESRAEPLEVDGLVELPVAIDWFAHRKRVRLSREELGERLAAACAGSEPVGVMLHHAAMGPAERAGLAQLLDLLAEHPNAAVRPMRTLVARISRTGPWRAPRSSRTAAGPRTAPTPGAPPGRPGPRPRQPSGDVARGWTMGFEPTTAWTTTRSSTS